MKYTVKYYQLNPANNRETYHNSKNEAMTEMRHSEIESKLLDNDGNILLAYCEKCRVHKI